MVRKKLDARRLRISQIAGQSSLKKLHSDGRTTCVKSGAVLRRGGWFDPGLIDSSAESLH